jgi:putative NADH-flavin reductase
LVLHGKRYESIIDAVNAGEATNRFAAMRLLKNRKRKDWNYISPSKVIEK